MPAQLPPPPFLRTLPTASPEQSDDFLADEIADSVVDHLPSAVRERARATVHRPLARRIVRVLFVALLAAYFAGGMTLLALRYWLLPEVVNYRPQIEQILSNALHRQVTLGEVTADWEGFHPVLRAREFTLHDSFGRPALQLQRVEASLAWDSLVFLEPRLAELEIIGPDLILRRDGAGRLLIAGIETDTSADQDPALADLLLEQHRIVIRNARVRWIDELRKAPVLQLENVNIEINNDGPEHRFGLQATPPPELAAPLDLRGELRGRSLGQPEDWHGELYLALADADLAAWQTWVDYPLGVLRGHGALRVWGEFEKLMPTRITADLRLTGLHARLREDLPTLDVIRLAGRIVYRALEGGESLRLSQFGLETADGLTLPATNFEFKQQHLRDEQRTALSAGLLDLETLSRLATQLPLSPEFATRLAASNARGTAHDLKFELTVPKAGDSTRKPRWAVTGRFERLGLLAADGLPGFSDLSGKVAGNQDSGELTLDGSQATLDLPDIFDGGQVPLGKLAASLAWDRDSRGIVVKLRSAKVENPDLTLETNGSWRPSAAGTGPGTIDLSARLSHAEATGVWRYIPKSAGASTRGWLKDALLAGQASHGTLVLKGDLAQFPFRNPSSGTFEVKARINDAALRYAESWPGITAINGELLFAGPRMLIKAERGLSSGARLINVQAEIADLQPIPTLLVIKGQATGPTASFLQFIESSPVGESIDHFTHAMQATGDGQLDLELQLPLETLEHTKVAGSYRITDNRLTLAPGLPPLTQLTGRLQFGRDELKAQNLQARLLGSPLSGDLRTANGNIEIATRGELLPTTLRAATGLPLFDHLAGSTNWSGTLSFGKRNNAFSFSSDLRGLSSALPAPFAKAPTDARMLRIERRPLLQMAPSGKPKVGAGKTATASAAVAMLPDLLDISLEGAVRAQWQMTSGAIKPRAVLALGRDSAQLPERDVQISAELPALDIDFWRRALMPDANIPDAGGESWLPELPNLRYDLRAARVRLYGKDFADVRMNGDRSGSLARFELKSAAFNASLSYDSAGRGRLAGVIPRLAVPESAKNIMLDPQSGVRGRDVVTRLPAIDLRVDRLLYKERELGRLTIMAENRSGGAAQWDATIALRSPETTLASTMVWRPDDVFAQTQVAFSLESRSIEKTLERIGFADTIRRGEARLDGTLSWLDAPVDIDYPSLTGSFLLDATKGQFNKLEPGVGRLLGILSLQTLPRRVTLDFRDIFSEGFSFDSIRGDFAVRQGVMHTDNLTVEGPAAKVAMRGQIDLDKETQALRVRVQPAIGESIAIGAMLAATPVAGAIAWAAQKLLNNPLDQIFSYDYAITGSWSDPKVDKLGSDAPDPQPAAVPPSPTLPTLPDVSSSKPRP